MANGKLDLRARVRHAVVTRAADALTLGVLSRRHRAQRIEVRELELRVPRWPAAHDGLRVAHVSDFHLGHLMPVERAADAVRRVGALGVDLLACTGDVVDLHADGAEPLFAEMAAVRAPLGHYLVLGNHDHLHDAELIASMARRNGVRLLDGEVVEAGAGASRLLVGGVDWGRSIGVLDRAVVRLPEVPDLLLAHNPKAFHAAAARGVPLTLSGHTHGGQVAWKGRPRTNLSFAHRLSAGAYARDGCGLFVNVGAGAWFPLRLHCAPEVVLLTVRRG